MEVPVTRFSAAARHILISRLFLLLLLIGSCGPFVSVSAAKGDAPHQPVVAELTRLLDARADLKHALQQAIRTSKRPGISGLSDYFAFLDRIITAVPSDEHWLTMRLELYYIVGHSPGDRLRKDVAFQHWLHRFVEDLGSFLDSPESAKGLETFVADPRFRINDYIAAPSGWRTFNQFFARHVKPGKRPIAEPANDRVVVSPADSVFIDHWTISADSKVTVKGLTWSVQQLLEGSPYRHRFMGGTMMQSYLSPYDYHRFHVPVGGIIREARKVRGKVALEVYKQANGDLAVRDELGYQFTQERALVVIESPAGLVAVVPVGMGAVSSVNLTADLGSKLAKGEEFGYFAFGGSDILVLFEARMNVRVVAEKGVHYDQGTKIAIVE